MIVVVGVIAAAMASVIRLCFSGDIPLILLLAPPCCGPNVDDPEVASIFCIAQTIKTVVFICKSKGRQSKYVKSRK